MLYARFIIGYFSFFFIAISIFAGDVSASQLAIVVQGVNIKPYDVVFEGIKKSYGSDIERIILYDYKGDLLEHVREKRPSCIFAIGNWAFSKVCRIDDIPIIYLMVFNPDPATANKRNMVGIDMLVPAQRKIALIRRYIPRAKRVGVIYSSHYSGQIYRSISDAIRKYHMRIIGRDVESAKEVPDAIISMASKIDVFIMLPDIHLITPETLHFMGLFFLKKGIPVVTFSEKYMKMGAYMAIYADPYEMGVQAGDLAKKILQKKIVPPLRLPPEKEIIKINPYVAKSLGLLQKEDMKKVTMNAASQ